MRKPEQPSTVAISLPEGQRRRADRVARRMRLSRSRCYVMAVAECLARREN